ncbi:hypothetical protein [Paenibacillus konkukensis]|uniref:hypothetical protein n=1 Tax=Paenibacillus konkukensis TaxID=2020716 RepID=UPI00201D6D23|nr:hypothetical protein [Paenibacillus konkukensis]
MYKFSLLVILHNLQHLGQLGLENGLCIPYGEAITAAKLSMIAQAKDFLIQLGFRQVRIRQHENLARIEVLAPRTSSVRHKGAIV